MSTGKALSTETAETARLGTGFIRWGTGLFIFGLFIGCGPLLHYIQGALEDVGPAFLKT